jgi:hypothetical protein
MKKTLILLFLLLSSCASTQLSQSGVQTPIKESPNTFGQVLEFISMMLDPLVGLSF